MTAGESRPSFLTSVCCFHGPDISCSRHHRHLFVALVTTDICLLLSWPRHLLLSSPPTSVCCSRHHRHLFVAFMAPTSLALVTTDICLLPPSPPTSVYCSRHHRHLFVALVTTTGASARIRGVRLHRPHGHPCSPRTGALSDVTHTASNWQLLSPTRKPVTLSGLFIDLSAID